MNMKRGILVFLVMAIIVAGAWGGFFALTGQVSLDQEGSILDELNFYNWEAYIPQEILDSFEDEYGIHVNLITFDNEVESKEEVFGNLGKYDLYVAGDVVVKEMISEGFLEEINKRRIKNFKNIDERLIGKQYDFENKYSIPYTYGSIGIVYSKEYFSEPPVVDDFWDVGYKERAGILLDSDIIISLLLEYSGISAESNSVVDYSNVRDFFEQQKEILIFEDSLELTNLLLEEEILFSVLYDADYFELGEEFEYVLPRGSLMYIDNMVIPKGAKNKAGAELFIDYLLRPEISLQILEYSYALTPVSNIINLVDDDFLVEYYEVMEESDLFLFSDGIKSNEFDKLRYEIELFLLEAESE